MWWGMWGQGRGSTHLGEEAEEAAVLHFFVHLRAQRLLVPLRLRELGHHAAGDERDGVVDGGRALGAAGEAEEEEVAEEEGGVDAAMLLEHLKVACDVRHALVEHLRLGRRPLLGGEGDEQPRERREVVRLLDRQRLPHLTDDVVGEAGRHRALALVA